MSGSAPIFQSMPGPGGAAETVSAHRVEASSMPLTLVHGPARACRLGSPLRGRLEIVEFRPVAHGPLDAVETAGCERLDEEALVVPLLPSNVVRAGRHERVSWVVPGVSEDDAEAVARVTKPSKPLLDQLPADAGPLEVW